MKFACSSICLSVYLSACLSVFLYLRIFITFSLWHPYDWFTRCDFDACDKLTMGLRHDLGPFARARHFYLQNKLCKILHQDLRSGKFYQTVKKYFSCPSFCKSFLTRCCLLQLQSGQYFSRNDFVCHFEVRKLLLLSLLKRNLSQNASFLSISVTIVVAS